MNYGSRVKANIVGLPKGYETMPFGRQIEYNSILKDFKDTAKTGYLDTKRKSVSAALAEFKKLYGVKEYYFIDTTAPGYKDDSIKIWYKTAMQANPAKPPITRTWKPVLIRTNAAGQVQITPQATVRVKAKAVQARVNPRVRKTKDEWQIQQYTGPGYGWEEVSAEDTFKEAKARAKEYRENQPQYPVRIKLVRVKIGAANPKRSCTTRKTGRQNPGDSGPLTPLDSILSAAGYSSRAGTTTRDASGEILRTEYRNGPGKSITVLSDRRGMGKPSYAWISNGPILPAHSGVRTKLPVATLKRTLKAHLKKLDKR